MKKILFIFCAIALVTTSCKKENKEKDNKEETNTPAPTNGDNDDATASNADDVAVNDQPSVNFEDIDVDKILSDYNTDVERYVEDMKSGKADRYRDYDAYLGKYTTVMEQIGRNIGNLTQEQSKMFWAATNTLQNYFAQQDLPAEYLESGDENEGEGDAEGTGEEENI